MSQWEQAEAIELCKVLEPVAARNRCHIALTGGLLYKEGARKDCDVIVYFEGKHPGDADPTTFVSCVDRNALLRDFWNDCQLQTQDVYSRVVRCLYQGKRVDLIFPELDGEYDPAAIAAAKDQVATLCLLAQNSGEQS